LEGELEGTEQACGARDGLGDESEFPKDALPLLGRDAGRCSERGEDLGEGQFSMGREFQGLAESVNDPTEDELPGGPATVPLQELLQRDSFVSMLLGGGGTSEDLVNRCQEVSSEHVHPLVIALAQLDEVVHEHVCVS
jgi:hypothetical protein